MHDRPDAPDLLAALARWLYEDLRPTLPRDQRYMALVAANTCAMLARYPDRLQLALTSADWR